MLIAMVRSRVVRLGLLAYVPILSLAAAFGDHRMIALEQPQGPVQADGIIRGRIFAADGGRPLARARIAVASHGAIREAISDMNGYEVTIPAGRYWLRVERQGFMSSHYGQVQPQDSPRTVAVNAGELRSDVDVSLRRYGVIAGRVFDDLGEPVHNAEVFAAAVELHIARTNDIGEFRIIGLAPGQYIVWANPPFDGARIDQTLFVPTYAPGTPDREAAQQLRVGPDLTSSVDITLMRGQPAEVTGTVVRSSGGPNPGAEVNLSIEHGGGVRESRSDIRHAVAGPDGSFVLRRVPPGSYRLNVVSGQDRGELDVTVGPGRVDGLVVTTRAGTTLTGHLTVEGFGNATCRSPVISASRVDSRNFGERRGLRASANSSGRFQLGELYGLQRLSVRCPQRAIVTSLVVNRKRVEGDAIDTNAAGQHATVEVTAAIGMGRVSGTTLDADAKPCDCVIVIVREDRQTWTDLEHFVWETPSINGQFQVSGLSPGDYFALIEPPGRVRRDAEYLRVAQARGKTVPSRQCVGDDTELEVSVKSSQM